MSAPVVLLERPADGIALLRLNRPEARNALNLEVRRELARLIGELTDDESVRAIILTGNEKAFAAGADIKEMAQATSMEMLRRNQAKLWRAVWSCPKPIVAAVNGFALGGGCELAMCCDIIVAGESAKFGQPEVKIGIIPGGGGTQRLPRAAGKFKAMRYLLTGDLIPAQEAFNMGLASEIVPDAEVERKAIEIAGTIAALSPLAIQHVKECVLRGMDSSIEAGLALETKSIQLLFSSEDQKEGMAAFIEKRKPAFKGR